MLNVFINTVLGEYNKNVVLLGAPLALHNFRLESTVVFLFLPFILQNYWVFGLCPASSILKTREHYGNLVCFLLQVRGGRLC
jgi:hypothetical protein